MPPPIQVTLKLNKSQLTPALRQLGRYSDKLPSELVNKACYWIAQRAKATMPAVPAATIQQQLEEYKVPVHSYSRKAGKLIGVGKSKSFFGNGNTAPFLALLVSARANPGSKFNKITGGVFKLEKSPWKGVTRAEGAGRMLETMRAMYRARVRSTGFYKVSAQAVALVFRRAIGQYRVASRGVTGLGSGIGSVSKAIGRIAGGAPATGKKWNARASFWVAATESDTKGNRGGLQRVAEPVWQRAVDAEAASIFQEAEKRYAETIRQAGFIVR